MQRFIFDVRIDFFICNRSFHNTKDLSHVFQAIWGSRRSRCGALCIGIRVSTGICLRIKIFNSRISVHQSVSNVIWIAYCTYVFKVIGRYVCCFRGDQPFWDRKFDIAGDFPVRRQNLVFLMKVEWIVKVIFVRGNPAGGFKPMFLFKAMFGIWVEN